MPAAEPKAAQTSPNESIPTAAQTADVLPPNANTLLGICWVTLFAGRWLLAPMLIAAGLLSATQIADLDDGILVRIYTLLLAATILVVALRAVRRAQTPPSKADSSAEDARKRGSSPTRSSDSTPTRSSDSTPPGRKTDT